jgi:glycosyltransferase involved in cell wall biosynthesis
MKGIHVCILAPVHTYDDIRIFQKEAVSLAQWKYKVTLYAIAKSDQVINNVHIKALPSFKKRIHRFLYIPRIFWLALKEKADFYHLHNPDTLSIGFALKLLGKKVIYDVHEDFIKRVFCRTWIIPFFRPLLFYLIYTGEKLAGLLFDAVIVTQYEVQSRIGKKAVIIENAPLTKGVLIDQAYLLSESIPNENFFRVIYVGRIGMSRGLMEMVRAMEKLNQKITARLWLIGPARKDDLIKSKNSPGWKYVDYLGKKSQENAFAHMIKSDAGLSTILDVADHRNTSINKLYEYQRFALPFVASKFKKWMDQLTIVKSGLFVNPSRPNAIAQALYWIATNPEHAAGMGKRGQNFVLKKFNWEKESEKLLTLYERLLNP